MSETFQLDYMHPYATLQWMHRPSGGEWADATTLSGYASGQGTRTLTIDTLTESENGHVKCIVTGPDGKAVETREAVITGGDSEAVSVTYTLQPNNLTILQTMAVNYTLQPYNLTIAATGGAPTEYLHDFSRGNPITLGGFNGTPTDGVYTDPAHRPSKATGADNAGVVQEVIDNVPVIIGASKSGNLWSEAPGSRGLQLEEGRSNYVKNSEDLSGAGWVRTNTTAADNGLIDGVQSWLIEGSASNCHISQETAFFNTTGTCTIRIGLRRGTATGSWDGLIGFYDGSAWLHPSTYTVELDGPGIAEAHGSNFTRIYDLNASTSTIVTIYIPSHTYPAAGHLYVYPGDSTDTALRNIVVFRPQWEEGAFSTSYIPNASTTAAVTRSATNCSATFAQLGAPLPASGVTNDVSFQIVFTILSDWDQIASFSKFITLTDGDDVNSSTAMINVQYNNATSIQIQKRVVAGTQTATQTVAEGDRAAGSMLDVRGRVSSSGGTNLWINGVKSGTNTNLDGTATPLDKVWLYEDPGNTLRRSNIIVHQVRIIPEALSDEDIEAWPTWRPTYFEETFEDETVGQAPSSWSEGGVWAPSGYIDLEVVSLSGANSSGKVLSVSSLNTSAGRMATWDIPGDVTNGQVLFKISLRGPVSGTSSLGGPFVRLSGSTGSENGLGGWAATGATLSLSQYVNGVWTKFEQEIHPALHPPQGEWLYYRYEFDGSSIKYRVWREDQTEPTSWMTHTTTQTSAGRIGYFPINQPADPHYIAYVAYEPSPAINGDIPVPE